MKRFRKIAALILTIVSVFYMCVPAFAADVKHRKRNRYNVVFVTDESGSMSSTDPDNLRYEAIRRFVALMAQRGNSVGSINFGSDIVNSQELKPITGFSEKEDFIKNLNVPSKPRWTNIGLGLITAVEMLNHNANQDNPSVIILLTDGNTDVGDPEKNQLSMDQKAEAIEMARQAGYPIYTICLNTDGSAASSELEQIAKATGGEFREVASAEHLEDIQTMYYKMIFGAIDGGNSEDIKIGNNGYIEKEFDIPPIGVEEFNVLLEGNVSKYTLAGPDGREFGEQELKGMSMSGHDFVVIKTEQPAGGVWRVRAYGDPGAAINFRLIYNSDFYMETSVTPSSDYQLGQTVTFHTVICDHTGPVSDPAKYAGFVAKLKLKFNSQDTVIPMKLNPDGFSCDVTLDKQGTYYAEIMAENGQNISASDNNTFQIDIDNGAPVATEEKMKAHANIWPFIGGSASLDISKGASDPDGENLTYSIESSAFMPEDYMLEGSSLTVSNYSISKGSFDIRATDPHGAYCIFPVTFTSTNIGMVMAILTLAGIVIAIIASILIVRKISGTPFMGTISVEVYDQESTAYSAPVSLTPGRGRIRLERFGGDSFGLPAGSYFQAGGKDKHIYFISKKPVFSHSVTGPVKKIPINGNGLEVLICADNSMKKGIRVTFRSILYNRFDF